MHITATTITHNWRTAQSLGPVRSNIQTRVLEFKERMSKLPPPVLLTGQGVNVQDIMTCTLCYEFPMEPVTTPCGHVFCRSCILQALSHKKECPNDRQPLQGNQLQSISGIARRIWEQVGLKCPNGGCEWTGTAGNYANHAASCSKSRYLSHHDEEHFKRRIAALEERVSEQAEEIKMHEQVIRNQSKRLVAAAADAQSVQFDRSYQYDRHCVVALAQLICKYLEHSPEEIDANRIFNCVKNCYQDLLRGYSDNPVYYYVDVRMLLSVCLASSTWFTNRQIDLMNSWRVEQGW
jgi:hypothetical protein